MKNSGVKSRIVVLVKVRIVKSLLLNNGNLSEFLLFVRVWSLSVKRLIKFFLGDSICEEEENGINCSLLVSDDVI